MPRNKHSDQRYEATRADVLYAVGPVEPNPYSGPGNPDPFGINQHPWTEFLIAGRIADFHRLPRPLGHVGRALKRNKLKELLSEMVTDGFIIGRPRFEWAAMGREKPSRAADILYAHPVLAEKWQQAADVPREISPRWA